METDALRLEISVLSRGVVTHAVELTIQERANTHRIVGLWMAENLDSALRAGQYPRDPKCSQVIWGIARSDGRLCLY